MARWSIRKMMMIVAGAAVCCAAIDGVGRLIQPRFVCGRRGQCESNMHNLALAMLCYYQITGSFPSGTVPNASLPPADRLGVYVPVSPYLEEQELYNRIDQTQPWHGGGNGSVAGVRIGILICPNAARVAPTAPQPTTSIGIAGRGIDAPSLPKTDPRAGIFGYDRQTTLADIKDGAANTMMFAESGRVMGSWLQGGPATVRGLDPTNVPYISPGRQFGGLHDDIAVIAMADGSVRVVSESIDPKVFEAMATIAGGEKPNG
jgi:Protein of unknown function (DUF1559)